MLLQQLSGLPGHLQTLGLISNEERISLSHNETGVVPDFIGRLLHEKSLHLKPRELAQIIAAYLGIGMQKLLAEAFINLPRNLLEIGFIRKNRVLPLCVQGETLILGISEPLQLSLLSAVQFQIGHPVVARIVPLPQLNLALEWYLSQHQYHSTTEFSSSAQSDSDEKGIVRFVTQIFHDALDKRASDIHFEPYDTQYRIRLRVDGLLHIRAELPLEEGLRVTTRLKVLGELDMAEKRFPQDGRFSLSLEQRPTRDFRISVCPGCFGEKVVVRVLDAGGADLSLEQLGLNTDQHAYLLKAISNPQGMILATGPTGSGKSLTLNTLLKRLDDGEKNICSLEDPVEMYLSGINQFNINPKIGLDFSGMLRALLRQDPDVLMIGEIRDETTAEIAFKAAQTGHLVLSTLHTRSASGVIGRLTQLGVRQADLSQALQLVLSQRLVRKLCPHCKEPERDADVQLAILKLSSDSDPIHLFRPVGCEHCTKGYLGRQGIFEILLVTQETGVIAMTIPDQDRATLVRHRGWVSLEESGWRLVRAGLTSVAELQRVLGLGLVRADEY